MLLIRLCTLLGSLLELVQCAADLGRSLDFGDGGLVTIKISLCSLGIALGELLAPRGSGKLVEHISIIQSLLEDSLFGETRNVNFVVGDGEALKVHDAADLIRAVDQSLR